MESVIYIINKIVLDEKNRDITSIFGTYSSEETLIQQIRHIYGEEYKKSIKNDDELKYVVNFRVESFPKYIKELNKERQFISVFSNYVEYKIYKCEKIDTIVNV